MTARETGLLRGAHADAAPSGIQTDKTAMLIVQPVCWVLGCGACQNPVARAKAAAAIVGADGAGPQIAAAIMAAARFSTRRHSFGMPIVARVLSLDIPSKNARN